MKNAKRRATLCPFLPRRRQLCLNYRSRIRYPRTILAIRLDIDPRCQAPYGHARIVPSQIGRLRPNSSGNPAGFRTHSYTPISRTHCQGIRQRESRESSKRVALCTFRWTESSMPAGIIGLYHPHFNLLKLNITKSASNRSYSRQFILVHSSSRINASTRIIQKDTESTFLMYFLLFVVRSGFSTHRKFLAILQPLCLVTPDHCMRPRLPPALSTVISLHITRRTSPIT